MADEPENLTLRILQEVREEMRQTREEMREMRSDLTERMTDLTQRVDGNTLIHNLLPGSFTITSNGLTGWRHAELN